METHPSRGRAIAGAATKPAKKISPSDYTRSAYIAPRYRRNAQKTSAREASLRFFRWGRNDTMGKSHPLLIGDGIRSAGSTMRIVLSTTVYIIYSLYMYTHSNLIITILC